MEHNNSRRAVKALKRTESGKGEEREGWEAQRSDHPVKYGMLELIFLDALFRRENLVHLFVTIASASQAKVKEVNEEEVHGGINLTSTGGFNPMA